MTAILPLSGVLYRNWISKTRSQFANIERTMIRWLRSRSLERICLKNWFEERISYYYPLLLVLLYNYRDCQDICSLVNIRVNERHIIEQHHWFSLQTYCTSRRRNAKRFAKNWTRHSLSFLATKKKKKNKILLALIQIFSFIPIHETYSISIILSLF